MILDVEKMAEDVTSFRNSAYSLSSVEEFIKEYKSSEEDAGKGVEHNISISINTYFGNENSKSSKRTSKELNSALKTIIVDRLDELMEYARQSVEDRHTTSERVISKYSVKV